MLKVGDRVEVNYVSDSYWNGPATVTLLQDRGATVKTDKGNVGWFSYKHLKLIGDKTVINKEKEEFLKAYVLARANSGVKDLLGGQAALNAIDAWNTIQKEVKNV